MYEKNQEGTPGEEVTVPDGRASGILATVPSIIPVEICGENCRLKSYVRNINAAQWLEVLLSEGAAWHLILTSLMPDEDVLLLSRMLTSGEISQKDISNATKLLLIEISGRNWWEIFNILALAEEAWEYIGGDMAMGGIIPSRITFGTWLDVAWTLIRRLALKKGERDLDRLVVDVKRPPESELDDSDGEMEMSAFLSAAGELAGTLPGVG